MAAETKPAGAIKRRSHQAKKYKRIPWPVCRFCGLVYLSNEATRKALRKGCWKYEDE